MLCTWASSQGKPALRTGGWAIVNPRGAFPSQTSSATASNNTVQHATMYVPAPPWAVTTTPCRIYVGNYFVSGNSAMERATGLSTLTLNYFAAIKQDASTADVNFGGISSASLTAGDYGIWSDTFFPFSSGATGFLLNFQYSVPTGGKYPTGMFFNLAGNVALGEGRESLSVMDAAKRYTAAPIGANSNSQSWAPALVAFGAYSGTTRILHTWGDSQDVGTNDLDYQLASYGAAGAVSRGMVDSTNGSVWTACFSNSGATLQYMGQEWGDNTQRRWAAWNAFPNIPCHDFASSLGINDVIASAGAVTLADLQAYLQTYVALLRSKNPNARIYHVIGKPLCSAGSNTLFTTVADQTQTTGAAPTEVWWQFYDWLKAGVGLPVTAAIDIRSVMTDVGVDTKWPVPGTSGTVAVTVSSGRVVVLTNTGTATAIGANVVLSTGTSNVETFHETTISGTTPTYTIGTAEAVTKTHTLLDNWAGAYTRDGTHSGTELNKAAIAAFAAAKLAGTIYTSANQ